MPAPSNDDFSSATTISGTSGSHAFDLTDATSETGEPFQADGVTVWFSWTAPDNNPVQFDTAASSGDPDSYLSVYTGSSVGALTLVVDDDDSGNNPSVGDPDYGSSLVTFTPSMGTTYRIQVDGYGTFSGVLTWGAPPTPPPPFPTATSWAEAAGRNYHEAFEGDDIVVTGTDLDSVTTVTVAGHAQSFTINDSTHLTVHVGSTARSGPIEVSNSTGSDTPDDGNARVLFVGPWVQPADRETSDPNFAHVYYGPADTSAGANVYTAQPDIEGAPIHDGAGAFTGITVNNLKFPDPEIDTEWDWNVAGGLILGQADLVQYAMPPIDYAPILAGDPTIWDVQTETPGGVALTDIAVSFRADDLIPQEWVDSTDSKSASDISGDLWQTAVQFRRLDSGDWTSSDALHVALAGGSWPSKSWIAALPVDVSIDLVESGDTLIISTEDDSGIGTRVNNAAVHGTDLINRLVPGVTLTWEEYAAGVAWIAALDRLVDATAIGIPYVDATAAFPSQRKTLGVDVGVVMAWTYRPPRYRLVYEEPPLLTIPPIRQFQRDDGLTGGVRSQFQATSRQASLRQTPRSTYL